MTIKLKIISPKRIPAVMVTVENWYGDKSITEDVANLKGRVDEDFIANLREIADQLEELNIRFSE